MLSAQCDELRKAAQTYRTLSRYETEQTLLDAADTITELRDDLQRANAENAKLRELVADMYAVIRRNNSWWDWERKDRKRFADRMRELGMEVQP